MTLATCSLWRNENIERCDGARCVFHEPRQDVCLRNVPTAHPGPLPVEGRGRSAERFMVAMRAKNDVEAIHKPLVKLHPRCRLDAPFPLTPALSLGGGDAGGVFMGTLGGGNEVSAAHEQRC